MLPTAIAQQLVSEQQCHGFAFDVELLMRADGAGLRIDEIPVLYVHDARSSLKVLPASLRMLREVAARCPAPASRPALGGSGAGYGKVAG